MEYETEATQAPNEALRPGSLLLSRVPQGIFKRAVILIIAHGPEGSMGVILNKPAPDDGTIGESGAAGVGVGGDVNLELLITIAPAAPMEALECPEAYRGSREEAAALFESEWLSAGRTRGSARLAERIARLMENRFEGDGNGMGRRQRNNDTTPLPIPFIPLIIYKTSPNHRFTFNPKP